MNIWLACALNLKILCFGGKKITFFFFLTFLYVLKAIDDDVIMHILRLRGKLGWETKLTSREWLAKEDDMAKLQDFKLTVILTFHSPHLVQLHILEIMLVINVKYLFPERLYL